MSGTGRQTPEGGSAETHWPAVVDDHGVHVPEVEQVLSRERADEIAAWGRRVPEWVPPAPLGPLPDDLRERAARLLQQQLAVAEDLTERILQSRRQREVAARMFHGPARPPTTLLDETL